MAFVTLPPNFQDMFYALSDRIAKLETGPNQAMYTAESAQGSSTQASAEATQALIQAQEANALGVQAIQEANIAIAQGTYAIQEANAAMVQATNAYNAGAQSLQKSASTITNASNQITAINGNGITVYSGASSSSGARVVLNSAGLAGYNNSGTATFAVDASTGAVTTSGAIFTSSTISGGSLNINGQCTINSSGVLYANGATIIGNITATSGTFTGTVYASAGTFTGTITSANATITGGTLTVGSNFSVNSSGVLTATGANITGAITATSGSFSGSINSTSGSIAGFTLTATTITNGSTMTLYNNGDFYTGGVVSSQGGIYSTAASSFGSTVSITGTATFNGSVTMGTSNQFQYLSSSGTLRSLYTYGKAVTGRAMQINSAGDFGTTASTLRKKHEVEPYAIDTSKLLQLQPKTFKYLPEIDEEQEQQYGFIAEEAEALGLLPLVLYNDEGQVDYFAYEKLPIFLLQLAQEQDARIKALEGN